MMLEKGGDIMLSEDPAVLEVVRREYSEFRALEDTHQRLEDQLAELTKLHILTPDEEIRKKQIQFEKLSTKDKMAEIVRQPTTICVTLATRFSLIRRSLITWRIPTAMAFPIAVIQI